MLLLLCHMGWRPRVAGSTTRGWRHPQIARNSRTPQYPSVGQPCELRGSASAAVGEKLRVRENKQPSFQPVQRRGGVHVVLAVHALAPLCSLSSGTPLWTLGIRLWKQVQRLDEGGWTCVVCLRNSPRPCVSRSRLPLLGPLSGRFHRERGSGAHVQPLAKSGGPIGLHVKPRGCGA